MTTAATVAPKRERYISLSRREYEALKLVSPQDRAHYADLKWVAHFKTGIVGEFMKEILTYEKLCAKLSAFPGAQPPTAQDAEQLVQRLAGAGLVSDIGKRALNEGLRFRLPLSPIKESPAEPAQDSNSSPAASDPRSVLKSSKKEITTTLSSEEKNAQERSGAGEASAQATPPTETTDPAPQALTREAIEARLIAGGFKYPQSDKSRAFYVRWIDQRISFERFERAVQSAEARAPHGERYPDAVAEKLSRKSAGVAL